MPYSWENNPSNPNAQPLYDGWGTADYWQCKDWWTYHTALVKAKGIRAANIFWVDAYNSGSIFTAYSPDCSDNSPMVAYFKECGIDIETGTAKVFNTISQIPQSVANVITNGANAIENLSQSVENGTNAVSNFAKYGPYIVAFIILLVLGLIIYSLYKNQREYIKIGTKATKYL